MSRPYPIIEYAHKIQKNTAEFTASDLASFMKWWLKQPDRKDLLAMSKKYKEAQTSRLTGIQLDDELVGDVEIMNVMEKAVDNFVDDKEVIIVEMGLTRTDVEAILFAIERVFADYEMGGHEFEKSLQSLLKVLKEA